MDVGHFRPIHSLGTGSFGQVWLVDDLATGRRCALKCINPLLLSRPFDEIHGEAKALVEAEHDHVVHVYSAGIMPNGYPYIAMEYLEGGNATDVFGRSGASTYPVVRAVIDACRGIQSAHNHGLLHRDIKPGNLLFGSNGEVKVSDFGLSGLQTQPIDGGFQYQRHLPPEDQTNGQITSVKGDVWGLGVTAYRLLNGDHFLDGSLNTGVSVEEAIMSGHYPNIELWREHVPKKVRKAVAHAVQINPDNRTASAREFRTELEGSLPVVSFGPNSEPYIWHGVSTCDDRRWRIAVVATSRIKLEIRRSINGSSWRNISHDGVYNSKASAVRGAVKAMNTISISGKYP